MKTIRAVAAIAATIGTPAFAQRAGPAFSTVVHHADLDLANPRDVRRLDHRIRIAVGQVCGEPSNADPSGRVNVARCRAATTGAAGAQRERAIAAGQNARQGATGR